MHAADAAAHVQERAQLNAEIARLREADAAAAAAKKSAAAALMREVDASNAAQLARRAAAKAAAIEDDKVIARFIQERDAREQVTHCLLLLLMPSWDRGWLYERQCCSGFGACS